MTEYRKKKLQKIEQKILNMREELQLLLDAESRNMDYYQTCEQVCQSMTTAIRMMNLAAFSIKEACASAEMEDVQDNMQMKMDHLTEAN